MRDKTFNKNYGEDDLETFGLKDIQLRKEYFRQKASRLQKEANSFAEKADLLDKYKTDILKTMTQLAQQGKKRLDGKTAKALINRDIETDCGLTLEKTRLHCTNDVVEVLEVYWADSWVVDTVEAMKSIGLSASARSRFYSTLEDHKGDPESMKAEAGLVILGEHI